ncbi:MAG: hypothetical protein J1F31_03940 [Erysipelotrichales bacterium]|nr:hypothetical protein [Erysipelotrichales bacterium]
MWKKRSINDGKEYAGEVVIINIKTIKKTFGRKKYQMYVACLDILHDFVRDQIFRYIEEYLYDNLIEIAKTSNNIEVKFLFVGPLFPNSSKEFTRTFAYAIGLRINNKGIQKYKARKILNSVGLDWMFD